MNNKLISTKAVYKFLILPIIPLKIIRNYLFSGTIVLLYHRVFDTETDPQLLCVSPENFEKQMLYLKRNFELLKVSELLKCIKEKRVPQKGIVITFDDGYADNYEFALPVLEKLKIPATFFVCTGNIDKDEENTGRQLEQIFFSKEKLPEKLEFEFNEKQYSFNTVNEKAIKHTYNELHGMIRCSNKENREKIVNLLFKWAGIEKKTRKYYRTLSSDELKKMANLEQIEIGGHTVNHFLLSARKKNEQKEEIEENKKHLEKILNKKISAFAYPYGRKRDYNQDTIEIVKNNYQIAFSNFPGTIGNNSNIYELPRFLVRNWDINTFKKQISRFL